MRVNVPNKTERFEHAPFVDEMTHHQCKVMINRLYESFKHVANLAQPSNKHISFLIDDVLDGVDVMQKQYIKENFFISYKLGNKKILLDKRDFTIKIKDNNVVSIPIKPESNG